MSNKSEYARLCSTKAKRAKLLAEIEALATERQATIARHEFEDPTEIGLTIHFGPYRVSMQFEGQSNVGAFLGHWFTDHQSDARYPVDFWRSINGSVNQYHFRKATTCLDDFDAFKRSIGDGLDRLASL